MPLVLIPTLDDLNIKQIEAHLEQVRTRRLTLVIQYQQARNIKLSAEYNKNSVRLAKQIELLGKDLVRLDEIYDRCKQRLSQVIVLKNETDFVGAMMEEENE